MNFKHHIVFVSLLLGGQPVVTAVSWSHLVTRRAIELMLIYQMELGLRLLVSMIYSSSIQDTGNSSNFSFLFVYPLINDKLYGIVLVLEPLQVNLYCCWCAMDIRYCMSIFLFEA